jgi:hypothetical protein
MTEQPIQTEELEANLDRVEKGQGSSEEPASAAAKSLDESGTGGLCDALCRQLTWSSFRVSIPGRLLLVGMALAIIADVITDCQVGVEQLQAGYYWWTAAVFGVIYLSLRYQLLFLLCFVPPSLKNLCGYLGDEEILDYFTVEGDLLTLVLLYAPCSLALLVAQKEYNTAKAEYNASGANGRHPDPPVVWQCILKGLVMEPFLAIPALLLAPVVIFYAAIDSALQFQEMEQPEMFVESKVFQDALFRAMVAQIMESIFESGFELIIQTHIFVDGSSGLEGSSYFPSAVLGAVSIVQAILLLQNHGHYKFIANRENASLTTADRDYYVETITAYVHASPEPVIVNAMGNTLGKEHLSKLQENLSAHPNLISLCGIATDVTEADLSGLGIDADDAIILASELLDKGALLSLDLSSNDIGAYYDVQQGKMIATPEGTLCPHTSTP